MSKVSSVIRVRAFGASALFTATAFPLRSLNAPLLTIVSPALSPEVTATTSPRRSPVRTNFCRAIVVVCPASFFFSSMANTESP